ncbi:MAG: aldo/keto reductase [Gemmatimonadota bacterium]
MSIQTHIDLPTHPSRKVPRIGLGVMPLSIAGRPDRASALAVIRRAVEEGVRVIDTADAYALDDSETGYGERLVADALREMGMSVDGEGDGDADDGTPLVATKGGMRRPDGRWARAGHPEQLREACHASLRALDAEAIPLYQLHNSDPDVPFEDSVGALAGLREEGKIRLIGISNVSVEQIRRARVVTPIASVQNAMRVWDPGYRKSPVVTECEDNGLVLLAHSPFGGAERAPRLGEHDRLSDVARSLDLTPHEAALHWLLATSPCVVPIPGTTRPERIESWLRALNADVGSADRRRVVRALRSLPGHRGPVRRVLGGIKRLLGM